MFFPKCCIILAMIRTILVFGYVIFSMIFLVPFGIVVLLLYMIGFRKSMTMAFYRLGQGWAWIIVKLSGSNVTVTGRENIPKEGGVCFVSNHCGYFDIVLLLTYCGRPFGFVAKKELGYIPFLNMWIYLLGGLFIDRVSVRKAMRTISKGIEKINKGGGMIIFPEGHRSKGKGLLPFKPGSLKLATSAKAPIVPIAIKGSYDVFEKNGRVTKTDVKVTFCEPIDTASLPAQDKKLVLSDKVYAVIKEKLG